tara:strand:+ start:20225 stop:21091 length:867 start_codon:yes stop_codon:yes gene_type:complete
MNRTECFKILGIHPSSDENTIKSVYKKIALKSHPDKVQHLSENERIQSEDLFKKSTTAYRILMGLEDEEFSPDDFLSQMFDFEPQTMNAMKGIFSNMATNMFTQYSQGNNLFENFYENFQQKVNVKVPITLENYFNNDVLHKYFNINNSQFDTDIECSTYPKTSRFLVLHNIEYELVVNMEFSSHNKYTHIVRKNGSVDIIYIISLNYYQYIQGAKHKLKYLDGNDIDIDIKPCCMKDIKIKNKGILGGKLIIKKNIINPTIENINKLTKDEYNVLISLIRKIYKDKI